MKNNKKDMIIMTVGCVLLLLISVGLLVTLFPSFSVTDPPEADDGVYEVELMLLGASEEVKTYELKKGDTLTVNVKADDGYVLPETIDVDGAEHTWIKSSYSEGVLTISEATEDVEVTISAFNEICLNFALDDQSDKGNNYVDGPMTLNLELNKPVTFEIGLYLVDCDFRFEVDEGITVTYTEPDSSDVVSVTVTWNGEIPDDGEFNFTTVYVDSEAANSVSLSLENCSVTEVVITE